MTEQRIHPTRSSETERMLEEEAQATQEWARGEDFHLPPAIKPRGTTLASVEAAVKESLS